MITSKKAKLKIRIAAAVFAMMFLWASHLDAGQSPQYQMVETTDISNGESIKTTLLRDTYSGQSFYSQNGVWVQLDD